MLDVSHLKDNEVEATANYLNEVVLRRKAEAEAAFYRRAFLEHNQLASASALELAKVFSAARDLSDRLLKEYSNFAHAEPLLHAIRGYHAAKDKENAAYMATQAQMAIRSAKKVEP